MKLTARFDCWRR